MATAAVFIFLLIGFIAHPGAAQAQNVDWLISVEDTGFDPTPAGGTIDYLVLIDNNGFDAAPATTMDFNIPVGSSLVGTSGDLSNCTPATGTGALTMTCDVPALASLQQVSQIVQVSAAAQGTITVDATIPVTGDILVGNNADNETTTITAGADIGLGLTLAPTAASGGLVDFVWTATNNGPNASDGFTLSFPTPAGIINMTAPAGCSESGGTWQCTVPGTIADGASVSRTFTGQINAVSGSTLTASASVIGQTPADPIATNDTDTGTVTITAGTDVAINKSRAPSGSLLVGDTVTFTLDTTYTGDAPSGLTVSDTVPGNYVITTVNTSGGWTCTTVGQDVNCSRPDPVGGGSQTDIGSIEIVTTVDNATGGSAQNTATIAAASPTDQDPTNNSDSDGVATISEPVVDLRANKSGPVPALGVIGNSYSYRISTSNIGNADFWGTIQMVDTIPAGLTLDSVSANGWSCSPTSGAGVLTVTCTRIYSQASPLGANATTPSVTLNTTVTGAGTLTNALSVSSPDANIAETDDLSNNATSYDIVTSTGPNAADVAAIKTASPDPVVAGEVLTYTLEITNTGPNTALDVAVRDRLSNLINSGSGATGQGFISASIATGSATGVTCTDSASGSTARQLNCTIDTLPVCTPGTDCPVITVQVRPGGNGGSYSNTFDAISQTTPDPDLANNDASASYTLEPRADVTVVKTATPDPVDAGQNLTYVVTAQNLNNGLSQADNVEIVDTLPPNVTYISASGSGVSCTTALSAGDVTGAADTVTCSMGNIANGGQRGVTIVVRPTNATQGTTITNNATVSTTTIEIDTTNNATSIDVGVDVPDVDLLVNKIDNVDPLPVDSISVYTVTVRNDGPSAAENVVMTDTLPPSIVSYQSHTVSGGGTCGTVPGVGSFGGTLQCSWGVIEAGDTETVTVSVLGVSKGTATNSVAISSDEIVNGWDRLAANNTASQDTTVRTRADVALTKTGPASVELLENFDFTLTVDVLTGPGLAEADLVEVTDSLPGNMELTGAPTALVTAGSATSTSCTGASGGTSFSCDLGTMSAGSQVQITVPVQVTAATANPYSRTNSATVVTRGSFDQDPTNNADTASVSVVSSSLAGTVYRDFADNGVQDGTDSGVSGITMTLTGTDVDGNTVTRTATTNASGDYIFRYLPEGSYTVTRGTVGEAYLSDGQSIAGSVTGTEASALVISTIPLPGSTDATDYDYTLIPQARVGIAKDLGAQTTNADGSFTATFDLTVENFSLEPLINVEVTDALAGVTPLFGTLATPATPATDPLANGTYAIVSAPSGSCGGTNGGFDGSGDQVIATGFGLGVGASCDLSFTIRVQPVAPVPAGYENQAAVDAEGAQSGQTSATNPQLADLSDDGTNPDPNGNGRANQAGENDPTPVTPGILPSIALVKTSDTSALSSPPNELETVTYAFEVYNTGNVTLTNITITDILPGIVLSGGPITLDPGDSDLLTFTGTYAISQADIDAGEVINQATVTGTDPYGTDVTDDSGTTIADDTPLTTVLVQQPSITLVKTADTSAFGIMPEVGETISYAFEVTNNGNVTLTNVSLTDILPGIVLSGGPITLDPGETDSTTFTATYAITQPDIQAGQVTNQATVTGDDPDGNPVTDDSGTTAADDDPTVTPILQVPSVLLDKVADTTGFEDGAIPGDVIPYSFTVTNNGNMILTDVTVYELLPGAVLTGSPIPVLNPGDVDTTTYTATYTVTLDDVLANEVVNDAHVVGTWGPGPDDQTGHLDSVTVQVGSIEAVPEVFPPFEGDGGTTTSMLASDLLNNGPATLDNVTITVIDADPGVTLDPATGLITLDPGYPAGEHTVEYEICSIAIPSLCDSTVETVVQAALPGIEATKTQTFVDVNGDGYEGVGDRIDYQITVENTGNTPLEDVVPTDTLLDLNGAPLALTTGPDFESADQGSPEGTLEMGEIAIYSASFTVDLQAINSGGVENSVLAEAMPVYGPGVPGTPELISDVSDNGIDSDGNSEDDPTLYLFEAVITSNGLTLTKTTPEDIVERGDFVPYTITVTNDNAFVVAPVDIVDTLPGHFLPDPDSATLDGAAVDVAIKGLRITWQDVTLPANGTVVVEIDARILNGARSGTHTNTVSVLDPATGDVLVGPATADVRILPEAIFDCSDVIGRVFEDLNGNGYQDDPAALRDNGITDQTYHGGGKGGKLSVAPQPEPTVERGIPGVRLVAPDGTVITTDENGLYSVPCAALPADRGSNFILKLDERTLPTGFRPTTENPRVVRLTPGVMAEINFGASIGKVVRIDLNRAAFTTTASGKPVLGHGLDIGIRRMVPEMAGEPVVIRLAWHVGAGADAAEVAEGRALMRLVEKRIRAEWRKAGRTQLRIETVIVRAGQ